MAKKLAIDFIDSYNNQVSGEGGVIIALALSLSLSLSL